MKKIFYTISVILLGLVSNNLKAQINLTTSASTDDLPNTSSAFLDASSAYDTNNIGSNNYGKGLVFPQVDLTTFEFDVITPDGADVLPTYYDGMVVYNTIAGNTGANSSTQGIQVAVKPGFYYFYNPNGNQGSGVSKGRWVRIGDKSEELTAKKVTGTFTHQGGTITPELTEMPDANDIKSIVSVKFYRVEETGQDPLDGAVMSTSLYSYKKAEKKAVFGHGPMSVSMPAGKYAYEIVYN